MRAFIGLEVNSQLQQELISWQNEAEVILGERWRMTRPHNFHMTLRFLGQLEESALLGIQQDLPDWFADLSSFEVPCESIVGLPGQDQTRVLALRFTNTLPLQSMVDAVYRGLKPYGFGKAEYGFLPHITLARHKSQPLKSFELPPGLQWPENLPGWLEVKTLSLFLSESHEDGVYYRRLFQLTLPSY
ncbi:MAG: RNA 2',3'-cyclic phosphodiesterase [Hydrogenovibrio sp.]|nr:RNA 2',3'-cyclic phosphodiesterase [Hydrogenovibrio sp.]